MTEKVMTFWEHFAELRSRLRISAIIFVITFCVYFFIISEKILAFLLNQFANQYDILLISPSIMSGFVTQIDLSLILSVATSLPVFIYEIFRFIDPALNRKTEGVLIKIFLSGIFLFLAGVAFVYFIMVPLMLEFFIETNKALGLTNYFLVESFFDFIIFNMFLGGMSFQTPLIVILANRVGLISRSFLASNRRVAYVVIMIIAGIITPDHSIISQLALGGMMVLLYEISIFFCK